MQIKFLFHSFTVTVSRAPTGTAPTQNVGQPIFFTKKMTKI